MADFTSSFWNWFIIIPTLGGILGCYLLVRWLSAGGVKAGEKAESMGHVWDENLEELNNPLPSWWLKLFYITMVFGLIYLALYPGLGSFPGLLGWTSVGQYQREVDLADASYGPLFTKFDCEKSFGLLPRRARTRAEYVAHTSSQVVRLFRTTRTNTQGAHTKMYV